MPANLRVDPFTDADEAVLISGEEHTVPGNSPYYVWLDEIPREENPGTLAVRERGTSADIQPDGTAGVDAYVFEGSPGTNYGTSIILVTGRDGSPPNGRYRSFIAFDLSSITAGSVVSATLRLTLEATGGGGYPAANPVGVHRVTSAWTEGAVNYTGIPTFSAVAEDVVTLYAAGVYEWDITDLVNGWLAGTYANHGLCLKHADESLTDTARNFTSSDGVTAGNRPMLRVMTAGGEFTVVARTATPGAGEVAVNYDRGALRFNSADAGKSIDVDYYGTGSPVDADDVDTLSDLIGEGGDGALTVNSGTTTVTAGSKSYTSIYVAPGATLRFTDPEAYIGCTGDVEIHGTVDLNGRGHAGGAGGDTSRNGQRGRGLLGGGGGQGAVTVGKTPGGGGGGGNATAGTDGTKGTGGSGGDGGEQTPSRDGHWFRRFPPLAGGGGGGAGGSTAASGGAGGAGGGSLLLQARGSVYVASTATLTATGSAGSSPNGGGGGGGAFVVRAGSRDIQATPVVTGGAGHGTGGGGANGFWIAEAL